jgi:hypothetical protein
VSTYDYKKLGYVLGCLTSAYDAAKEKFVKARIEEGLTHWEFPSAEIPQCYKDLVEGWLESKSPLELIVLVAEKLPCNPVLSYGFPPPGKPGFYGRSGTLYGKNENGEKLIETMINAVRERRRARAIEQGKKG